MHLNETLKMINNMKWETHTHIIHKQIYKRLKTLKKLSCNGLKVHIKIEMMIEEKVFLTTNFIKSVKTYTTDTDYIA